MPPEIVVAPVVTSLSFWPAGLMLTVKNEPEAKLAVPATFRVEKGVSTPGATVPPLLTIRPPIVPEPPIVAPDSIVAVETIAPVTASVPTWTSVEPV